MNEVARVVVVDSTTKRALIEPDFETEGKRFYSEYRFRDLEQNRGCGGSLPPATYHITNTTPNHVLSAVDARTRSAHGLTHSGLTETHSDIAINLMLAINVVYFVSPGIFSASLCTACWPGYYSESVGAASYATCIECPSNHSQPIAGAASQWDCIPCSDDQVHETQG